MSISETVSDRDQYNDGRAADVWESFTGGISRRKSLIQEWICSTFRQHGVSTVLDVACGVGLDSIMLVEGGFRVVSTDLSDRMLKHALRKRWARRKEPNFDQWVIEEANWLHLQDDLSDVEGIPEEGFDAVMCIGNSFAHLLDPAGDGEVHRQAIENMRALLKPSGLLLIDHRNYDFVVEMRRPPSTVNVFTSSNMKKVDTAVTFLDGRPTHVHRTYTLDVTDSLRPRQRKALELLSPAEQDRARIRRLELSYFPHLLKDFQAMLGSCFGPGWEVETLGDFQPLTEESVPDYFIHLVRPERSGC